MGLVDTKLHDIVILQHGSVPRVGGPVSRHMVQAAPGGEGDAGLQPVCLDQVPHTALQGFHQVDHLDARLGNLPDVLPHLATSKNITIVGCLDRM